jgi:hypothetical protein
MSQSLTEMFGTDNISVEVRKLQQGRYGFTISISPDMVDTLGLTKGSFVKLKLNATKKIVCIERLEVD